MNETEHAETGLRGSGFRRKVRSTRPIATCDFEAGEEQSPLLINGRGIA
jgi:hypothetical protein